MAHDWIPRLDREAMTPALNEYLGPRVKRLGYLGEMFQVSANTPEVLLHFLHLTDALKDALPFDIGEAIVLTVAGCMDNQYERNQHERLCIRSGVSRDWIVAVQRRAPDEPSLLTPAQRAAQRYVLDAIETRGLGVEASFAALGEHFTPKEAMTIAFLVGRYMTHALLVNTLQLTPPVPSIFEDGFTG